MGLEVLSWTDVVETRSRNDKIMGRERGLSDEDRFSLDSGGVNRSCKGKGLKLEDSR